VSVRFRLSSAAKLCGGLLLGLIACAAPWLPVERARERALDPNELTPDERAAGLKIGARRDSFKLLTDFRTAAASSADLPAEHRVLAVEIAGEARAYPIFILNHHEILADVVGGVPLLVSY
jgi:hypothetical protein